MMKLCRLVALVQITIPGGSKKSVKGVTADFWPFFYSFFRKSGKTVLSLRVPELFCYGIDSLVSARSYFGKISSGRRGVDHFFKVQSLVIFKKKSKFRPKSPQNLKIDLNWLWWTQFTVFSANFHNTAHLRVPPTLIFFELPIFLGSLWFKMVTSEVWE